MNNPFYNNSEASAWSDDTNDFLFNSVHSHITLNLAEATVMDPGLSLTPAAPIRFCVRCHPNEAERLWNFVHEDSVKKEWEFMFDGKKTRLHSATGMKCLEHLSLVCFFNFNPRLLICVEIGSPIAVVNFPLKRAHATHVVPAGVFDSTGVVQTLPNKSI